MTKLNERMEAGRDAEEMRRLWSPPGLPTIAGQLRVTKNWLGRLPPDKSWLLKVLIFILRYPKNEDCGFACLVLLTFQGSIWRFPSLESSSGAIPVRKPSLIDMMWSS